MISFAEVSIGAGGVVPCARCSRTSPPPTPRATSEIVAEVAAVAAAWSYGPGPNVVLGGFEPFRHPALPALIASCADAGCSRIMLRTDAGALSGGGNAAGALSAGVRAVEVVLLADGARHDELSGRPGLFETAAAGVAQFADAAASLHTDVALFGVLPVCKHNVADAASAVVAFARLGARSVGIDAEGLPVTDANGDLLMAALHTATVNRVAAHVVGWSGELAALYRVAAYDCVVAR